VKPNYDSIDQLDGRYFDPEIAKYLSERSRIVYQAKVEAALAKALAEFGICPLAVSREIGEACGKVTAEAVAEEERTTKHDVKALVNVIKSHLPDEAKPFVHFGATSYDIVSTAMSLQLRAATQELVIPRLNDLQKVLLALTKKYSSTVQIGRTHGQHAVPITFGFAVAEYVSRLGGRILLLRAAARALPGKLSGAVGAYHAPSLLTKDPRAPERRYLAHLGLVPASHSTQIVEPEAWSDLAHACVTALGVMANLADDMRHLQRTEIAEIAEGFRAQQVGSSTMPQKRNPVSFENVKSIWKAFMPRIITTYLDQISEHQRDLTNSASQRFSGELLAATAYAATRLGASIDGVHIDRDRMKANVGLSKGGMEHALNLPVVGEIPSDSKLISESNNKQNPFVLSNANAPASQAIAALANALVSQQRKR